MGELRRSARRVLGVLRRYVYLIHGSWLRYADLVWPPLMQLVLWGFISRYFSDLGDSAAHTTGMLLSAVLLWSVVNEGQRSVVFQFTEEVASRHIAHLFASPIRAGEFVAALFLFSLFRIIISCGMAAILIIPLQHFSIFATFGPALVVFFFNLLWFTWSIALMTAFTHLTSGLGAGFLTVATLAILHPLSGVYYPIEILPAWLQPISWCLPTAPVFEGMRAVIFHDVVRLDLMLHGVLLNVFWTCTAIPVFLYLFHISRQRGLLLQVGE
jgi:ABC-2 type transport system permease protein